jgi:two-component system chemotaxis sensor kinase CheA
LNPEFPPGLQQELLDDFFTECDEHLAHVRRALLLLEPSIGKVEPERAVIDELFHSFHSFKGISGIVGLRVAEELAHAAEDYLRVLTSGTITLTVQGVELLMQATQRLEQIALAFRRQEPYPGTGSLVQELRSVSGRVVSGSGTAAVSSGASAAHAPSASALTSASAELSSVDRGRADGLIVWKITFTPSRALDERGVNVSAVRARLAQRGEILNATAQVLAEGEVVFEFMVGMKETPADIALWEADGLAAELVETSGRGAGATRPEPGPDGLGLGGSGAPGEHNPNPFLAPSHVVRVDLPRLDELMRIVGEMVIKKSRLEDEVQRLSRKGEALDLTVLREVNGAFGRSLRQLREGIMRVRMVPVAEIFARLPFVVRDLVRESGRKARLTMEGQQTEIDKYLIEQLKDPLLHLVRNAFSHGVEAADVRRACGKPEEATIRLHASASGDSVVIMVSDDGPGVSSAEVVARARSLGLAVPEAVDRSALLEILCSPGFSTRADADLTAGRGVGMSVVRKVVRELGGTLALETKEGRGATFIIRVPLTLAVAETLIVSAAEQTCAVAQNSVSEVLSVTEEEILNVNGLEAMAYRDGVLPLVRLTSFFQLAKPTTGRRCVLVLRTDRGSTGLVVDQIHGQREVVVRALRDPLIQAPGVAGATELGDGRPVLILDAVAFTGGAVRPNEPTPGVELN